MANLVTVAPVLGHPVVATQGGFPEGFDAIDDRRVRGIGRQTGVLDAASYKVTPGASALQLSVAANSGEGACVKGVNVTAQGLYYVAPHASTMLLDVAPGDATNPRVDQVILEVLDADHDGGGEWGAQVLIVEGTPTAGADLDNRAGADPLTGRNYVRLCDFVVDPGESGVIPAVNIRDRRAWASGALYRAIRNDGGSYTTTSGTNTDIDATNLKPRVECSGAPIKVSLKGQLQGSVNGQHIGFTLSVDGTPPDGVPAGGDCYLFTPSAGGYYTLLNIEWVFTPSPGSHLLTWLWRVTGGATATLFHGPGSPAVMTVEELVRPFASND